MTDTHVNDNGTDTVHPRPTMSGDPGNNIQPTCTSDVTAQTVSTIIQRIKGLETQINNMKSSVIARMESKLDEMKSSLIRLIDNTASKTYSQAVQQFPVSVDSSSIDEGYLNNTIENTFRDISQTLPKTVFSPMATVDTQNKKRSLPKGIPVRVTVREQEQTKKTCNQISTRYQLTEATYRLQRKH